jgi:hypothetical protein
MKNNLKLVYMYQKVDDTQYLLIPYSSQFSNHPEAVAYFCDQVEVAAVRWKGEAFSQSQKGRQAYIKANPKVKDLFAPSCGCGCGRGRGCGC